MAAQNMVYLHEEIMLLALRDEEGTIAAGSMYQYAIGGAILAELLLSERIGIDESNKKKLINVLSSAHLGEPLIDECLEKISSAKRRASLKTWVSRFACINDLKHRIAEQLCQRGILRVELDKVFLIFTRKIYPEIDPEPERELVERLRAAIFTDTSDVDPRTVVLISLADSADLLNVIFDRKSLKTRKERLKQLTSGEITGEATKEAVAAMQAAVMIAVIMPVIVTTTVSS